MLGAAGHGCWHYDFVAAQKSSVGEAGAEFVLGAGRQTVRLRSSSPVPKR